jgi:hypothetical protein
MGSKARRALASNRRERRITYFLLPVLTQSILGASACGPIWFLPCDTETKIIAESGVDRQPTVSLGAHFNPPQEADHLEQFSDAAGEPVPFCVVFFGDRPVSLLKISVEGGSEPEHRMRLERPPTSASRLESPNA